MDRMQYPLLAVSRHRLVHCTCPLLGCLQRDLSSCIWGNPEDAVDAAARALGLSVQVVESQGAESLESAFQTATTGRCDALLAFDDPFIFILRKRIVELAAKSQLPAMYGQREFAVDGGLMAYGTNAEDMFRRAATYVAKILEGAKPADLPVEQPTRFELVINLKTAKALGITVPTTLVAQATEVIE